MIILKNEHHSIFSNDIVEKWSSLFGFECMFLDSIYQYFQS